jgi:hypothetical protein
VIFHPDDLTELQRRSRILEEATRPPSFELTDLGAKAHRIAESREGELIEDETTVRNLLGI